MKISEMSFEQIESKIWPDTTCMFTEVSDTFSDEEIKELLVHPKWFYFPNWFQDIIINKIEEISENVY